MSVRSFFGLGSATRRPRCGADRRCAQPSCWLAKPAHPPHPPSCTHEVAFFFAAASTSLACSLRQQVLHSAPQVRSRTSPSPKPRVPGDHVAPIRTPDRRGRRAESFLPQAAGFQLIRSDCEPRIHRPPVVQRSQNRASISTPPKVALKVPVNSSRLPPASGARLRRSSPDSAQAGDSISEQVSGVVSEKRY